MYSESKHEVIVQKLNEALKLKQQIYELRFNESLSNDEKKEQLMVYNCTFYGYAYY